MLPSELELELALFEALQGIISNPRAIEEAVKDTKIALDERGSALTLQKLNELYDEHGEEQKDAQMAAETRTNRRVSKRLARTKTIQFDDTCYNITERPYAYTEEMSQREKMILAAVTRTAINRVKRKYLDRTSRFYAYESTVLNDLDAKVIRFPVSKRLLTPNGLEFSPEFIKQVQAEIKDKAEKLALIEVRRNTQLYRQISEQLKYEFLVIFQAAFARGKESLDEAIRKAHVTPTSDNLSSLESLQVFDPNTGTINEKAAANIELDQKRFLIPQQYFASEISARERLILNAAVQNAGGQLYENYQEKMFNLNSDKDREIYQQALADAYQILNKFNYACLDRPNGYHLDPQFANAINKYLTNEPKGIGYYRADQRFGIAAGIALNGLSLFLIAMGIVLIVTGLATGGTSAIVGFALCTIGALTFGLGSGKSIFHAIRLYLAPPAIVPQDSSDLLQVNELAITPRDEVVVAKDAKSLTSASPVKITKILNEHPVEDSQPLPVSPQEPQTTLEAMPEQTICYSDALPSARFERTDDETEILIQDTSGVARVRSSSDRFSVN